MTNAHIEKIIKAYKDGRINKYMAKRLISAVENGVTETLADELIGDAQYASDMGIENDEDYNVYFFTVRFADDMLEDTFGLKVDPDRKKELCRYILSNRDGENYTLDNLTDYRLLMHKWLCDGISKKAYPNITGKSDREPIYDVDKWIDTLKNIYSSLHNGQATRHDAIDYFTSDWDADEKYKFVNWMKYYEGGNTEKYNVKTANLLKQAFDPDSYFPQSWVNNESRADDSMHMSTRKEKREQTKKEKDIEKAKAYKSKMRSRLRAFKRLMEKYNDLLPKQDMDSIYDELYALEKSISKLDVYASLKDCIIRTANKMNKMGFYEGAEFLHKTADETSADLAEALPQPGSKEPDLPAGSSSMVNIQSVISRLEAISKELKSRDMIRELASIDILLNDMGMASYFPEISYAQSKLIESFSYASNKVEDIVAKLRGSGKSTPSTVQDKPLAPPVKTPPLPAPAAPAAPSEKNIDTGEIMSKPVGEIQKKLPTG